VEAIATRYKIARNFAGLEIPRVSDLRLRRVQTLDSDIFDFEENLAVGLDPRRNQILYDLVLAINRNRPPCQILEIDTMSLPSETQFNPVMNQAFTLQPLTHPHLQQQINRTPLEHPSPNALLAVLPAPILQHHRLNVLKVQKVR
jgi:hypothetical protein